MQIGTVTNFNWMYVGVLLVCASLCVYYVEGVIHPVVDLSVARAALGSTLGMTLGIILMFPYLTITTTQKTDRVMQTGDGYEVESDGIVYHVDSYKKVEDIEDFFLQVVDGKSIIPMDCTEQKMTLCGPVYDIDLKAANNKMPRTVRNERMGMYYSTKGMEAQNIGDIS